MGFLGAARQADDSATNRLPRCRNGRRLNAKKRGRRFQADQADELASIAASDDGGRQMDLVRCSVLYVVSRYNIQRRKAPSLHVNLIG